MRFDLKTLVFWVLGGVVTLGLIGCTTGQVPDLSFLQGESPLTVIQGVVMTDPTQKSLGSIPGLDSLPQFESVSSQADSGVGSGVEIELITEEGEPLQKDVFEEDSHGAQIPFRFQGNFDEGPLRLRIHQDGIKMDVALGTLVNNGDVIDLPAFNPKKAALATRYLEQTRSYRDLRRQTFEEFHETREEIYRLRIENLDNLEGLKSDLDQVGVDSEGRLRRYSEEYQPMAHRMPEKRQPWERDLFSLFLPEPWVASETQTSLPTGVAALPKVLQNRVQSVALIEGSKRVTLYQKGGPGGVMPFPFPEAKFNLQIVFGSDLSLETREYLKRSASLSITQGQNRSRVPVSDFSPFFPSLRSLELSVEPDQLSLDLGATLVIHIHERLPDVSPGVVYQAFARMEFLGRSR